MSIRQAVNLKNFIPDDRIWVIVLVTTYVRKKYSDAMVSEVAVALAPTINQDLEAVKKELVAKYDRNSIRLSWVPVRFLRVILNGSLWQGKDNARCLFIPSANLDTFSVDFPKNPQVIDLGMSKYTDTFGDSYPYVVPYIYPLGPGLNSKALLLQLSNNQKMLIPCSEILRAEYGASPMIIEAILGGWFENADTIENLINVSKTEDLDFEREGGDEHKPHIHLAAGMSRHNKRALALLCSIYHDDYTKLQVKACWSGLVKEPANRRVYAITPPSFGWVQLKTTGFWMPLKTGERLYFVSSIRASTCTLPILDFTWRADNDNEQVDTDEDELPSAYPNRPKEHGHDLVAEELEISDMETSPRKSPILIDVPEVEHSDIQNINAEKVKKTSQNYQNDKPTIPPTPTNKLGPQSGGQGNEDATTPEYNEDPLWETPEPRISKNILNFISAFKDMYEQSSDMSEISNLGIKTLQRPGYFLASQIQHKKNKNENIDVFVNRLPTTIDKVPMPFSHINIDQNQFIRTFVMFILSLGERQILLIEVEREEVKEHLAKKEPQSSAYICERKTKDAFTPNDINQILRSICENGPTLFPKKVLTRLKRVQIKHTKKDLTSESKQANRIRKHIMDMLTGKEN